MRMPTLHRDNPQQTILRKEHDEPTQNILRDTRHILHGLCWRGAFDRHRGFPRSATDSSSDSDLPVVWAPRPSLRDFAARPPLPRNPDARLSPKESTVLALGDRVLSP